MRIIQDKAPQERRLADRIAGAVSVVGISHFVSFLENTESYRRAPRRGGRRTAQVIRPTAVHNPTRLEPAHDAAAAQGVFIVRMAASAAVSCSNAMPSGMPAPALGDRSSGRRA